MIRNNTDPNLNYYLKEMSYLHRISGLFASKYPKIAERLEIGQGEFSDPHIARMMESFAYLTARLQKEIDDQFPLVSSTLLGVLYPHLTRPIPPLSIAHFDVDPQATTLMAGYDVPKGTKLFTHTKDNQVCRFQTAYNTQIWPIEVEDLKLVRSSEYQVSGLLSPKSRMLKLKLRCLSGMTFKSLGVDRLRFYINTPEEVTAHTLYEGLFSYNGNIGMAGKDSFTVTGMPSGSLKAVGFDDGESLFPFPHSSNAAYRLLQEYFAFPQKFFFFDINNLQMFGDQETAEIFLPVTNEDKISKMDILKQTFLLGCTPITNLFKKTSEPIRLDHKSLEYKITPDYRKELTTEIYSIEKVSAANDAAAEVDTIHPYFWLNYNANVQNQQFFWHGRRQSIGREGMPGTEMHLSFIDFDFNPKSPPHKTIFAHTLCTNRQLASRIPAGGKLDPEEAIPADSIFCLHRPTSTIYPSENGETQWNLISQLALNHLSLSNDDNSLDALKKMLLVHADINQRNHTLDIDSIASMTCEPAIRRTTQEAWRGFARGTAVKLEFDERNREDCTDFLLANVLHHFFGMYCTMNSFTELTITSKQRKGVWKKWPPIAGSKTLL